MSAIVKRRLNTESVPIDSVTPHPKNMRQHDQANIEAIAASLKAFGQLKPIVVWKDNLIIAGCGTHEAAKSLGWTHIQIARCLHLSENAAMEYLIADNKTTDMSEFDFEQLAVVMRELKNAGSDLASTGFSEEEILPLVEGKLFASTELESAGTTKTEDESRPWRISFTHEEWRELIGQFVKLAKINVSLDTPTDLVKIACKSCQVEFVLHCVKCYKPQKPKIIKR